ncbi:MAG: TldD/PmbA family protein [Bacteroidales bacterium]|nr:TldD/PmbA family protein [Bacteroidales bacterium]
MITKEETGLCEHALGYALANGATKVRVTLAKSQEDLIATLNGEIDRVTHCLDRSLSVALFCEGKFGSFSTNKLEEKALDDFVIKALNTVRMLAVDSCRDLPSTERCEKNAVSGNELELVDPGYHDISPEQRKRIALDASIFGKPGESCPELVSEEGEYSDSIYDTLLLDSNGTRCRHTETSFDYGVEMTVEVDGDKYSGYWWHSSSRLNGLRYGECGPKALKRAMGHAGAVPVKSGKYNMVIESDVASKVVSPILHALNGYSIQQNNSFLMDSLGKKMFPDGVNLVDLPHIKGNSCSKLFDSEGVATREGPIIENGTVRQYFINTYMAGKLGMAPTVEEPVRPALMSWPEKGLDSRAIMKMCSEGILVTDFNGGNCNSATGDFSYGIEGYYFKDGEIVKPVCEMLITGNFLKLWKNVIAIGDDARECMSKLIPTLAFSKVDFSG